MEEQQQTKLEWDISNIEGMSKLVVKDEKNSVDGEEPKYELVPVTQALIFAAPQVGMPSITKANFAEFWLRLRALDAWLGSERIISIGDVEAHVGLKTNAEKVSQAKWFSGIKKLVAAQYKRLKADAIKNGEQESGNVEVLTTT